MSRSTFAGVVEAIFAGFVGGAPGAGDGGFAAAISRTQDDVGKVKGVQEESGGGDGDRGSAGPALATPFGDMEGSFLDGPLALLLLLAVLVSAVFVTRGIVQALR